MLAMFVVGAFVLSANLSYMRWLCDIELVIYARDIILWLSFVVVSVRVNISTYIAAAPVLLAAIYFLASGFYSGGFEYWRHFLRNLFSYSLLFFLIFSAFRIRVADIYSTIPVLNITGLLFQWFGIIDSLFPDRYVGLYLGPGIAGAVNLLYILFVSNCESERAKWKEISQLTSLGFIFLSQSILFMGLGLFAFIYFNRSSVRKAVFYISILTVLFYETLASRIDEVFLSSRTRTINGRVEAFQAASNIDGENILWGLNTSDIVPLDSSYLFVLNYAGIVGLFVFALNNIFILVAVNLMRKIRSSANIRAVYLMLLLNVFISLVYNLNFSYIFNLYIFSLIGLEYISHRGGFERWARTLLLQSRFRFRPAG